jgi:hypothetical protein
MKDELREAYQEQVKAQIKELEARIDLLKTKAERAKADAKVEYHQRIDELNGQRKAVQSKLQILVDSGKDAWQDLKGGVDRALGELRSAVENALTHFQVETETG